jgi:hypothetical protein
MADTRVASILAMAESHELYDLTPKGDVVLPAAAVVQKVVSRKLSKAGFSFRLVWHVDKKEGMNTVRLGLRPTVSTLQHTLWLQVANFVVAGKSLKSCQECRRWFAVSRKAPRARSAFCSDACRVRAYRQRQDLARQKAAAGESFEAIAKELGSNVKAVRRWVTGHK